MHHRAAVIPRACSVLAQMGPRWASMSVRQVLWRLEASTVRSPVFAAVWMDSPAVVYGSNGQPPRRARLTW